VKFTNVTETDDAKTNVFHRDKRPRVSSLGKSGGNLFLHKDTRYTDRREAGNGNVLVNRLNGRTRE
jgi:hypothetical protein